MGRMIAREPTLERLAIARELLLTPFGLDETHLLRALSEIRAHRVDDADLYFQYTRSEGWRSPTAHREAETAKAHRG